MDMKQTCKSCKWLGVGTDPDTCYNPNSPNCGQVVDWEGGFYCDDWEYWREDHIIRNEHITLKSINSYINNIQKFEYVMRNLEL